jgi:hypothetical protein
LFLQNIKEGRKERKVVPYRKACFIHTQFKYPVF